MKSIYEKLKRRFPARREGPALVDRLGQSVTTRVPALHARGYNPFPIVSASGASSGGRAAAEQNCFAGARLK
jgi:hypothetical protein